MPRKGNAWPWCSHSLLALLCIVLTAIVCHGEEPGTHIDFYPGGSIDADLLARASTAFIHVPEWSPGFRAEYPKTWVRPTDGDLTLISQASKLKRLDLVGGEISSRGWRQIQTLGCLASLTIRNAKIDEAQLAEISRLPALTELRLLDCQLPPHVAQHLEAMTRLKQLRLNGCNLTDRFLAKHALPSSLELLDVSKTNVGCQVIGRLPTSLKHLRASEVAIDQACLEKLEKLTRLEELKIDAPDLSSGSIHELRKRMPGTRVNGYSVDRDSL